MDISYLLWLQGIRESSSEAVQALFRFLGSEAATLVILVVPCLAYWCLDKRRGTLALFSYGLSWLCNQLVKNTVCCYRPWVRDARVHPEGSAIAGASGYSFPSGHTQSSASMLGGLGWAWRDRRWPLALAAAFTLLIGFSRNFLGVHTPQDVLVGLLEGCVFIAVAERLLAWVDAGEDRDLTVAAGGLVATVAFLVYVTQKPYPLDYADGVLLVDPAEMLVDCYKSAGGVAGMLAGWLIERRWTRFETEGLGRLEAALRMLVGLLVVLAAYKPFGKLLVVALGPLWGQLLRHLLTFVVAVGVVPLAFARLHGRLQALR